jgi:hypothetical protein
VTGCVASLSWLLYSYPGLNWELQFLCTCTGFRRLCPHLLLCHCVPALLMLAACCAGVYYEQGKLDQAIATYREALVHEPNFPEAYNNLGNALREAGRVDEAIQCYTLCIQLQLSRPQTSTAGSKAISPHPVAAAQAQAQRLSVAYNNLGGILKMQVILWCPLLFICLSCIFDVERQGNVCITSCTRIANDGGSCCRSRVARQRPLPAMSMWRCFNQSLLKHMPTWRPATRMQPVRMRLSPATGVRCHCARTSQRHSLIWCTAFSACASGVTGRPYLPAWKRR